MIVLVTWFRVVVGVGLIDLLLISVGFWVVTVFI